MKCQCQYLEDRIPRMGHLCLLVPTCRPMGPFSISSSALIVLVALWWIDFSQPTMWFSLLQRSVTIQFFGSPVYCSCTPSGCFCYTVLLLFLQYMFDFMLDTVYSATNQGSGLLKSCHVMVSTFGAAAFLLLQNFVDFFSPVIWYPFVSGVHQLCGDLSHPQRAAPRPCPLEGRPNDDARHFQVSLLCGYWEPPEFKSNYSHLLEWITLNAMSTRGAEVQ